jgi:hypothetical protein
VHPGAARHFGGVGREAVVQGPAWIARGGEEGVVWLTAADHHDQRGVRLEEAGEIAKRRKLGEALGGHRAAAAEGDDYAAVEPCRKRVAAGRVLGGGNGLRREVRRRGGEPEEQREQEAHGSPGRRVEVR